MRQSEERSGLNPDGCRFDSCSGHCATQREWKQRTNTARKATCRTTLAKNQGCCGFESHLSYSSKQLPRPRGAAWSARHPVKVEAVGSNPIGDAYTAWYANWQSDGFQTSVVVGSTPSRAT